MAIARLSDCEAWHREYRELYWELNELELVWNDDDDWLRYEYNRLVIRMKDLVALLGYHPEP